MKRQFKSIQNQRGFSIIELIGVIVVIAILAATLAIAISTVRNNAQASTDTSAMIELSTCVQDTLAVNAYDYSVIEKAYIRNQGCVPSLHAGTDDLRTSQGAEVDVVSAASSVTIEVTASGSDEFASNYCYNLVSGLSSTFNDILVDTSSVITDGVFDGPAAAEACDNGATQLDFVIGS